jgi:hypothetical protein
LHSFIPITLDPGTTAGRAARSVRRRLASAAATAVVSLGLMMPGPPAARAATTEFNILPLVGGNTDVGIGFGQVGDWARLDPNFTPYKWRIETSAFITFKPANRNFIIPYQDYFVVLSLPKVGPHGRMRLDIRPSFTDESTLKFYGFGNASTLPPPSVPVADTEYGRIHPTLLIEARADLAPRLYSRVGSVFTLNSLNVPANGTLAMTERSGTPEEKMLLGPNPFANHAVEVIEVGLEYDTRDSEIVTHSGQYHSVEARLSPSLSHYLPYPYQQIDGTFRFYATPVPRWLTVSLRLVGDLLLGQPPFYELARFDETSAIGGVNAVRGVPAQRYYGKVKVFENLEARTELWSFTLRGKHLVLGAATFLDAGRIWTQAFTPSPALDGTGLGLKYGVGGGIRLAEGKTFVVRADIAWSPDATPIGAYFAAGEIF